MATNGGRAISGINTPPMNSNGNLMRFVITIISDVWSDGFAEIRSPKIEPKTPINMIPMKMKNIDQIEVMFAKMGIKKMIAINDVMIME